MKIRLLLWLCVCALSTSAFASGSVAPFPEPQIVLQTGHQDVIYALAVAPSGKLFASGDDGGNVKVWTYPNNGVLFSLQAGAGRVGSLQFSKDSARLLVTTEQNISVWELSSGKQLWVKEIPNTRPVAFSRGGKSVVIYDQQNTQSEFDAATGKTLSHRQRKAPGYNRGNFQYALSPDGKTLVSPAEESLPSGKTGKPGLLIDAATGVLRHALHVDVSYITQFAFSPSSQTLAVPANKMIDPGKSTATVQLFNVQTGKLRRTWNAYGSGSIESIAFSPDGKTLVTSGADNSRTGDVNALKLWDSQTGALLRSRPREGYYGRSHPQFSSDGKSVFSVLGTETGPAIENWNWKTGAASVTAGLLHQEVDTAGFSPDGKFLLTQVGVTGGLQGSVLHVWNLQNGALIKPPWSLGSFPKTEALDNGQKQSAVVADGTITNFSIWAFSPSGSTLVVANPLQACKWPSGQRIAVAAPGDKSVPDMAANWNHFIRCLDVAADGRIAAVGFNIVAPFDFEMSSPPAGELVLWNIATNRTGVLQSRVDIKRVTFSPDGKRVAAFVTRLENDPRKSSAEKIPYWFRDREKFKTINEIEIWDVASRRLLKRQSRALIKDFIWLDDGKILILQSRLGWAGKDAQNAEDEYSTPDLQVWDTAANTVKPFLEKKLEYAGILVAFSPRAIAVAQEERVLWLSLPDGKPLGKTPISRSYWKTKWTLSPDQKIAVSMRGNGEMECWNLKSGEKIARLAMLPADSSDQLPNWIVWTPDGNFDCSLGTEKWIRFRQNGKLIAADKFPSRRRANLMHALLLLEDTPVSP